MADGVNKQGVLEQMHQNIAERQETFLKMYVSKMF